MAIPLAISADGHVLEPLDLWTTELPASLRARGPRVEQRDGAACFVVDDRVIRRFPRGVERSEGEAEARLGGWGRSDPEARLRELEKDGVWAEVIYPNIAFFCCYAIEDAALQTASCRLYNEWLREQFLGSPRFVPVALLPVLELRASLAELERAAGLGFKAALLPTHADFRPYNDPAWEPLWEAAASRGVVLSFHAGTGRSQTPAHGPGGAIVNYVVTVSGPMETVAYLCGSGVLERHPDLQVVMVESGAGWLAWTLDAMDDAYREHAAFVKPKLEALPSEYFRRQGHVTFMRDPVGIANLPHTGTGCLMWGSDYPHPEGTWPHSREILERQFKGVPQDVVNALVYRNAAELYGIEPPPSS